MNEERLSVQNVALDRARQALRLASASLPHLSGLARLVRIKPSRRTAVASIAASGLMLINPDVFAKAALGDAAFVLSHELLHLALNTHSRAGTTDLALVNFAHDYIINDILREELERDPPLGGLDMAGAREKSLEELAAELAREGAGGLRCWTVTRGRAGPRSPLSQALEDAGLVPPAPPVESPDPRLDAGDLIPSEAEGEYEPELSPESRRALEEEVHKAAAKAASLAEIRKKMAEAPSDMLEPTRGSATMRAIRDAYALPWELALQRWLDAVAPGERTYARPSRRGELAGGCVRPGRLRHGWALHIVLDTSGSMVDVLPRALGAIAEFCDASNVSDVHILQCDAEVTRDEWLEPSALAEYEITGFGYSDMSPAMRRLAEDPEVEAVLVLTDGYIDYPAAEPPYRVLWCLIGEDLAQFEPPYGQVVKVAVPV